MGSLEPLENIDERREGGTGRRILLEERGLRGKKTGRRGGSTFHTAISRSEQRALEKKN